MCENQARLAKTFIWSCGVLGNESKPLLQESTSLQKRGVK